VKYLELAFSFLTILPARLKTAPEAGDLGRAGIWYPLVGLVIGGIVVLAHLAGSLVFPPILSAALALVVWEILTGGLHLDGLADCCDGLFNASSPERRLEIMRDPRLGTFGGAGLFLHLLLKFLAILSLPPGTGLWAIPLAAAASRWLILLAGSQPMARPGGLGADFSLGLERKSFFLAAILPLVLMVAAGWLGLLSVTAAVLVTLTVFQLSRRRLGGLTGDVIGLIVELAELTMLLVFCLRLPLYF
jgi:adenosylcobinamide-GDP ribazoletransferase